MKLILPQKKVQKPQTTLNLDTYPIPFDTPEALFREKLDSLNRDYLDGCLEYVSRVHPGLLDEAQGAEKRLDQVLWLDTIAGKATLGDFKTALETWHRAYLACFEAYSKRPQGVETGRLFR